MASFTLYLLLTLLQSRLLFVLGDFNADFTRSAYSIPPSTEEFKWTKSPPRSAPSTECSAQGVLQMRSGSDVTGIRIELKLREAYRFTFHVGDSPSNDGYGGDYGVRDGRDDWAELHNVDRRLHANRDDPRATLLFAQPDKVTAGTVVITLKSDYLQVCLNGKTIAESFDKNMFHFYPDYNNLYLGINRVVWRHTGYPNQGRFGRGLCSAKVTWLRDTGRFKVDLTRSGYSIPSSAGGFTWTKPPPTSAPSAECSAQGVLQMRSGPGVTGVRIELRLREAYGFTFHVGDVPSNDGYGGDYGVRDGRNDWAELHNVHSNMLAYRDDPRATQLFYMKNVTGPGVLVITLKSDYLSVYLNGEKIVESFDKEMFHFYPDYNNLYLGINRVVWRHTGSANQGRVGRGLCTADVTWLQGCPKDKECQVKEDFVGDFSRENWSIPPSTGEFKWTSPFPSKAPCECSARAVLQMRSGPGVTGLRIELKLRDADRFTFHVADSPSNDGYGGDYGFRDGRNDWAELHNVNTNLLAYRDDSRGTQLFNQVNVLGSGTLIITLKSDFLSVHLNGTKIAESVDKQMFHFYPDYNNLYLGINRVVWRHTKYPNQGRDGRGLCSAKITWLTEKSCEQ